MIIRYTLAWFGMMGLAIINGALRDFTYRAMVGELAAHQISTVTLILLFALYFWFLVRHWPIESVRQAYTIGAIWLLMTEVFEIGLGRLISNHSWEDIFQTYNVLEGQLWILIPIWTLIGPYIFFRYVQKKL